MAEGGKKKEEQLEQQKKAARGRASPFYIALKTFLRSDITISHIGLFAGIFYLHLTDQIRGLRLELWKLECFTQISTFKEL